MIWIAKEIEQPNVNMSPNVKLSTFGSSNIFNPYNTINIDIHKWIFLLALPIKNKMSGTIKTLVPVINADLLGFEGAKKMSLPNPSHKPVVWNE